MPKLILSIDGVVIKEVQLTKDRTTLGRRPYNDVVIDNLAVSGEHAAVELRSGEAVLEDLGSTNGTYVNGKAVKRHTLRPEDIIEVGKYRIRFVGEAASGQVGKAAPERSDGMNGDAGARDGANPAPGQRALIKVLSGSAAGRELSLQKVVTTFGKPGHAVAAITRRPQGYVVSHVDGDERATLNGTPVDREPVALNSGDTLELAGTRMQFVLA